MRLDAWRRGRSVSPWSFRSKAPRTGWSFRWDDQSYFVCVDNGLHAVLSAELAQEM